MYVFCESFNNCSNVHILSPSCNRRRCYVMLVNCFAFLCRVLRRLGIIIFCVFLKTFLRVQSVGYLYSLYI